MCRLLNIAGSGCMRCRLRRPGRNHVARLVREMGISGNGCREFRRSTFLSKHAYRSSDPVRRIFRTEGPHRVGSSDATRIDTQEAPCHLSGDAARMHPAGAAGLVGPAPANGKADARCVAVRNRFSRRPCAVPAVHSDHGSQHTSDAFWAALARHGFEKSMGRIRGCLGNAVAESLFAHCRLQTLMENPDQLVDPL